MALITKHGLEKSKDSLYYDVDDLRIDAWRWQEDTMELQLSLRLRLGHIVFSIQAQPFIDVARLSKGEVFDDGLAADVLKRLRTMMVLDDLAGV